MLMINKVWINKVTEGRSPSFGPWSKLAEDKDPVHHWHSYTAPSSVHISGNPSVDVVESFVYLGSEIHSTGSSEPEVAWPKDVSTFWVEGSGIPVSLSPPKSNYILPISNHVLHSSETWALTRALQDKEDAFDNICLRRIFRVPYTDHVTNATRHRTTLSRLTAVAVSTHPDQTASILWTRGKEGYVTWHH